MFISSALAAETAHGAAPAAGGVFPPFDPTWFAAQLFWLAIIFLALYWMMSRVALPRVADILATRRARIDGDLAEAAAAQKHAAEAAAGYEKTLAEAKAGAQKTAQDMRDKIAAETDARRKALEADLNGKLAAAEARIAAGKTQAMSNVAGIAQDAAAAIVQQLTGKSADAAEIASAIAATKPN